MTQHSRLACFVIGAFCIGHLYAQDLSQWKDPSNHSTRFVTVDKNVQLEVLDWGGLGRSIILLAVALRLTHLTTSRQSSPRAGMFTVSPGVDTARPVIFQRIIWLTGSATDVVAVIDALKINKPILVGHSVAGAELSSVANRHPDRIAGLVYLDAAYSYAFDNGKGFEVPEMQNLQRPKQPALGPADLASFSALGKYYERMGGVQFPEAELRQQWESNANGKVIEQRDLPGAVMVASLIVTPAKYTNIPVPALVIFANPHSQGPWVERNTDASVRASANAYSAALAALTAKQEKAVKEAVPTAHVVELPNANHFVFLSNEADVLREMRNFVAPLN